MEHSSAEFPTRFQPKEVEEKIYALWEQKGCFTANPNSGKEPFVIVIPPPNVTGSLHMGHALNNTLQDILIRWRRMQGREALYLPGTDHAGIATQFMVEKELAREKKNRFELGREKFLERVWKWKEQYGNTILYQLRRLGCSCDWSRTRFTMDENYSRAVRSVFVSLYRKGLIYKDWYPVNWCPRCLTALSDIEVEQKEEPGTLWYVKYPIQGAENQFITVATTRPETMLGDTAVAVHPDDTRYRSYVGKKVVLPFVKREIPIIADAFVDPKFGTGAVKITPAHDVNDFEASKRHKLPAVVVIDEKGVMNENAGELFRGLDRFETRKKIVEELKQLGLLEKEEPYAVALGRCYRCKTILEPYLSEQWFVRMKPLAQPAIEAVRSGQIRFVPERFAAVYLDWLEKTRDWCISRQLWWGHRIPVWTCPQKHATVELEPPACAEPTGAAGRPTACGTCGADKLTQDESVLDTWFSSALWPFATLGWPHRTVDLEQFYPTDALITGRDIIYLWVARMVMMGFEFCGKKPFSHVFINPTIQNPEGKRMSKSLGTGVDPLELMGEYGADALRFGLTIQVSQAQDLRFSPAKIVESRNFVTKLWNAARFVAMNAGTARSALPNKLTALEDRWIVSRLGTTIDETTKALEEFRFGDGAQLLYRFIWNEFCDWYIELAKRRLTDTVTPNADVARGILLFTLEHILRLLHPFTPFVTEALWERLRAQNAVDKRANILMLVPWPKTENGWRDTTAEQEMDWIMKIARAVREIRNRMTLANNVALTAKIKVQTKTQKELLMRQREYICFLAPLDDVEVNTTLAKPPTSASVIDSEFALYVPLEGKIDVQKEVHKQEEARRKLREQMEQVQKKLDDANFREKAPTEILEREEQRLDKLREQLHNVENVLKDFAP